MKNASLMNVASLFAVVLAVSAGIYAGECNKKGPQEKEWCLEEFDECELFGDPATCPGEADDVADHIPGCDPINNERCNDDCRSIAEPMTCNQRKNCVNVFNQQGVLVDCEFGAAVGAPSSTTEFVSDENCAPAPGCGGS